MSESRPVSGSSRKDGHEILLVSRGDPQFPHGISVRRLCDGL